MSLKELYLDDITKKEIISVYRKYPFLVPLEQYRKWEGVIYVQEERCHLLVITPNYPSLKEISVFSSCKALNTLDTKSSENETLLALLQKFEDQISSEIKSKDPSNETKLPNLDRLRSLAQIVSDIEKHIGQENVESEDSEMNLIKVKYVDSVNHENFIRVALDSNYPEKPLRIVHFDLPDDVLPNFNQIRHLGDLYVCFKDVIESLIPFWKMIEELSEDAWVIEPKKPTRKDPHRRIFISDNLSVQLTFYPLKMESIPDIKFLGSLDAVSRARETYQKNLQESGWWEESSIASNVSRLLGLDLLPTRGKDEQTDRSSDEEELNDCVICYETNKEGESFPAKWCSNKHCSGRFHHFCLIEWLNSVPTSKTSFDHISGPCPHCDEKIFCPIKLK